LKNGELAAPKWALAALPPPPVLEFESAALGFKGEQSALLCSVLFVNVQNIKLHYAITPLPRGVYMVECSMKQSPVEL